MSYICCKGIYTVACANCYKQLCPTSGHGEVADYNKNYQPLCRSCAVIIKPKPKLPSLKERKAAKLAQKDHQRLLSMKDRYEKEIKALKMQLSEITKERDELLVLINSGVSHS